MIQVIFNYDEDARKWDVVINGASDQTEATHAFNAVIRTCHQTVASVALPK